MFLTAPCTEAIALFERRHLPEVTAAEADAACEEHAADCLRCMARRWQLGRIMRNMDIDKLVRELTAA